MYGTRDSDDSNENGVEMDIPLYESKTYMGGRGDDLSLVMTMHSFI